MKARSIVLMPEGQAELDLVARRATRAKRDVFRAAVVLRAAAGAVNEQIASETKTRPATASKQRGRLLRDRIVGLQDAPRFGRPATYDRESECRILAQLDHAPPQGYARWNGSLLAALKDISDDRTWRVLRKHGISLERRNSWRISTDSCIVQRAADVVRLFLNPPEHAPVLSVDEKPHILTLERTQGRLKLLAQTDRCLYRRIQPGRAPVRTEEAGGVSKAVQNTICLLIRLDTRGAYSYPPRTSQPALPGSL